jgi:hypothetical protein
MFSSIQKSLKLELEHQDTYDKKFYFTVSRISFSRNYHIQKSAVKVYTSLSLFVTVNENTRQTFE